MHLQDASIGPEFEWTESMSIELSHLRYVVTAAEHRSFRRAAAALNITQPTLSKRIRELECRLEISLFERSTGGVILTADGKDIVVRARRVLAELDEIKRRACTSKVGDVGRLEIGFYTSLAGPLRDTLSLFARQHARVDVSITEDSRSALISLLDRGVIDVAIVIGEVSYRDYAHMTLWSERIMVACTKHHALAHRDPVYWSDLKSERFVMSQYGPGPEIQDVLLNRLSSPGNRPLVSQIKAHHSVILSVVENGAGVTLTCESSSSNATPGVVFREIHDGSGPTRLGFAAYWRRNNDNPILKQFVTMLHAFPTVMNPPVGRVD